MSPWTKMLGDRPIGREKPLGMARGLEPLHASLPLAGRLVRVLCTIIEMPVLTMFHHWKQLAFGGAVALQFIRHDHARHVG